MMNKMFHFIARESVIVWDSNTGKPLHNTVLWLDTRTITTRQKLLDALGDEGKERVRRMCGLPIETYFSALKLRWLYDHVPEVKTAMDSMRNSIIFVTFRWNSYDWYC